MRTEIKWDLLSAEDIEVRMGNKIKDTDNVTMLLYQDSRCTARNLDKQFGPFGWQMDYKVVGDQIYGTLSIWDDTKQQWVSKSDTGDKSNISEDKGQSSDILKRCAVRWGFGTELYTAPKIVIPNDGYGNSGYKVSEIAYSNNKEITHLVIVNRFDKEVFRWDKGDVTPIVKTAPKQVINDHKVYTKADLEWSEDKQPVAHIQMTKTLTPAEQLTQWYQTTTHTEATDRFFSYYMGKINTGNWKGKMDVEQLWQRWMK